MARSLNVKIVGDASSYQRALRSVNAENAKLKRGFGQLSTAAKVGIGAGLVGIGLAARSSIKELVQQQKAMAQTQAVLKSTGGAANVTKKQVTDLSGALLKKTGIDDEVIQSGENMLLTFRNIKNEVGANNDIFTQATKAGLDMSTAMAGAGFEGGNLKTTMIRLGKALNDPVTGMTALRRVGVTFTEDQKKTIKRLEETGHHLEAQKIILRELRAEFGGSAEAYGKTLPGRLTILRESLKNVGAQIIAHLVPAMEAAMKVGERFGDFLGKIAGARSFKVSVRIAASGLASFEKEVQTALSHALLGFSTTSMGQTNTGEEAGRMMGETFHKGLVQQLQSVDWSWLGKKIGEGFQIGADALDNVLSGVLSWVQSHSKQLADVGVVLLATMMSRATDPSFWAQHIGLGITLGLLVFSRGLSSIAEKMGLRLAALLGPSFERAGGEATLALMRAVARLPASIGDAIAAITPIVGRAITALVREVALKGSLLGRLLKFGVIVTLFRAAVDEIKQIWGSFVGWLKIQGLRAVLALLDPFSHLPGRLGGWARDAKDKINDQLDKVQRKVPIEVSIKVRMPAGARGPVGIGDVGDGIISVISARTRKYAAANPSLFMPQLAPATGNASGLKPMVLDDLALGQSMGLSLSSGYRPGAVTSTGNKSLHSVGQAIDMVGAPFAMANFAHAEAGRSGVAEVLYSPVGGWYPGVGWTKLSGKLRQDHFSHVHVGVRSGDGRVGVGDGVIAAPHGGSARPRVDAPAPSPLAGLRKRIAALRAEERKLKAQISSVDKQIRTIDKTKKKTKAQVARRKTLAAHSSRLHARLKTVQAQLVSLNQRVQEVIQHDYSELPISIQLEQAQAALTETSADDVQALIHAQAYLERQLRRPGITGAQRVQLLQALAGVRGDLSSLTGSSAGGGESGAAGPADNSADLEAQLAQSNARYAAANESARLASAFVSTGVFGGSPAAVGAGGSTIIFNNLIPDAEQIRRATEAIAAGAGAQPYIASSVTATGY